MDGSAKFRGYADWGFGFGLSLYIAETCALHLFHSSGESSGTYAVHFKKPEGLSKRHPLSSRVQKLDLSFHSPEDRF